MKKTLSLAESVFLLFTLLSSSSAEVISLLSVAENGHDLVEAVTLAVIILLIANCRSRSGSGSRRGCGSRCGCNRCRRRLCLSRRSRCGCGSRRGCGSSVACRGHRNISCRLCARIVSCRCIIALKARSDNGYLHLIVKVRIERNTPDNVCIGMSLGGDDGRCKVCILKSYVG